MKFEELFRRDHGFGFEGFVRGLGLKYLKNLNFEILKTQATLSVLGGYEITQI